MNNRLQLFVERQDQAGSFIEVDRFSDESINVVDSIQNVKDISKIFSPFTRAFSLPSSPTNDEVFGHYYNNQVDTYDARFRTRAILKISGADYKSGHISMENANLLNSNSATSYRVKFTDETTTLKDKIGEDKLTNLNYETTLSLPNEQSTIVNGIRRGVYRNGSVTPSVTNNGFDADGYKLYPDVIYAPIFTKGKAVPIPVTSGGSAPTSNDYPYCLAYFDSENSEDGVTTAVEVAGVTVYKPRVVKVTDYRPAVKVSTMLDMINSRYALGFSNDFMYREELDQLYLWHNGKVQSDLQGSNAFSGEGIQSSSNTSNYTLESFQSALVGDTTGIGNYTAGQLDGDYDPVETIGLSDTIIHLNKGEYTGTIDGTVSLVVLTGDGRVLPMWTTTIGDLNDDGEPEYDSDGYITNEGTLFNSDGATAYDDTDGYKYWRDELELDVTQLAFRIQLSSSSAISGGASFAITRNFKATRVEADESLRIFDLVRSSFPINITTGASVDLKGIAPDMKVLDFVSGIFKMFNLTYYSENRFATEVQTIDEFYNNPDKIDIGEYVTLEGATISKAMIYKDVTMKYNESDDAMSGQYTPRANGERFPDLYDKLDASNATYGSSATAEGNNLSIKAPFSCMMYERLYTSWSDEGHNYDGTITPYAPTFDSTVNHSAPNAITDVVVGHSIDSDLKKKDIKNLLFYGKKVQIRRNFNDEGSRENGGVRNGLLGVRSDEVNPEFNANFPEYGNSAGSQGRIVGLTQTGFNYQHHLALLVDDGVGNTSGGEGFAAGVTEIDDDSYYKTGWWNPSNIMASKFRRNGLYMNADSKIQGLQFSNVNTDEYEYKSYINTEWNNSSAEPIYPVVFNSTDRINGLYDTFYKSYLTRLYNKSSRLYKIQGKLPDYLISSYKMNDVYRIGNKEFTINKANINIMNGESTLELLTHTPPDRNPAVINFSAFKLSSGQFYDESIEFDLTSIRITGNNFPDTIRIQSGSLNNDYEYVINGLTPADFGDPIGDNLYALTGIVTPEAGSGQTNWVRSNILSVNPHTAYAILEHSDGSRSNRSNSVIFRNPADTTAPTATIDVVATSSTNADVSVTGVDNNGGSGVGRVKITSQIFGGSELTQVDQSYNGDFTTFVCTVASGTLNTFKAYVYDNVGNESSPAAQTVAISTPDTTPPEQPIITGSTTYNSGFNIDLEIENIVDNIEVDFVSIKRSTNGSSFVTIDTEDPNGDTEFSYRDAGLSDTNNYKYYVTATDTSGNVSTNSNYYEYIGDSEGDN